MKDSNTYAKKIEKLFRSLKKSDLKVPELTYDDPLDAVVDGVLTEHLTLADAEKALKKIQSHFVDYNDLRVSRPEEINDVLKSKNDDKIKAVAKSLPDGLGAIFAKYHAVTLEPLAEEGKRQAKKELEEMVGLSRFAQSYTLLTAIGGHAIPVNQIIADYLKSEKLVNPESDLDDIEGFLERRISAADAFEFYWLLRLQAEESLKAPKKKTTKKRTAKKKKTTKKNPATKKKTAKKTTAKKKTEKKSDTKKKTAKKATTKKKKSRKK
ncbi:valyl-tRNA synthetase [Anaerohalosphaera lusitana]|uniref:Valyl-tRNA synthetase n=1 Tax=Anaerohalosphaera lusitana TaxID=1936003 RepID=A0A1U9NIW3_9BACT|nr:hypothetical protein [Anaerohalosphaera lusitana]AQT67664.1 valyl-tRNA synthetase [Anaerohalosphaera lusitana]